MKASYSRRIRRPGTQELNPFPTFFDVQNVVRRQPDAEPGVHRRVRARRHEEHAEGHDAALAVLPPHVGRHSRRHQHARTRSTGRDVTTISFKNLATSNSWGTDVNGQLRLGPKFTGFGGFNVFKMVTDGGSTTARRIGCGDVVSRVNGTSEMTKTLIVAGVVHVSRADEDRGRPFRRAYRWRTSSLRKKLDGDKASVTLRVTDPFNTGVFRVRAGDDKVIQLTERELRARERCSSRSSTTTAVRRVFGRCSRIRAVRVGRASRRRVRSEGRGTSIKVL